MIRNAEIAREHLDWGLSYQQIATRRQMSKSRVAAIVHWYLDRHRALIDT